MHGFPVLSLQFSRGKARQTGQRTAIICLGVSFSGTTMIVQLPVLDSQPPWRVVYLSVNIRTRDGHSGLSTTASVRLGNEIRPNADSLLWPLVCDGCHPRC